MDRHAGHPAVDWAEPDIIGQMVKHAVPNDPLFAQQWALHNTGQGRGTPDADVDAAEAWDLTTSDGLRRWSRCVFAACPGGLTIWSGRGTLDGPWTVIQTNIAGTGNVIQLTDTRVATAATRRYYRVRVLP